MKKIKPPNHLREETRKWFTHVVREFTLEQHHIRLLTLACEAWDRSMQAREALAVEGVVFLDRFGQPHARPEIAIERDSRTAFARLLRELALDISGPDAPKPPTITR